MLGSFCPDTWFPVTGAPWAEQGPSQYL